MGLKLRRVKVRDTRDRTFVCFYGNCIGFNCEGFIFLFVIIMGDFKNFLSAIILVLAYLDYIDLVLNC